MIFFGALNYFSTIQTTLIISIILISDVGAFNLDVTAPVVKQVKSPNKDLNSYFSYSIAQHSTKDEK